MSAMRTLALLPSLAIVWCPVRLDGFDELPKHLHDVVRRHGVGLPIDRDRHGCVGDLVAGLERGGVRLADLGFLAFGSDALDFNDGVLGVERSFEELFLFGRCFGSADLDEGPLR